MFWFLLVVGECCGDCVLVGVGALGVWWLDGVRKDVVVSVSMAVYTGLLIAAVAVLADSE